MESGYDVGSVKFLNEICVGDFQGLSIDEIKRKYPQHFNNMQLNKLSFRYPGIGGESILDVIERLRPVIIEIERLRINMVVVTHNVVLQTLLAYFSGLSLSDMVKIKMQPNTLYKLEPTPYGADLIKCY